MRTFILSTVFVFMVTLFFAILSLAIVILFPISWKELTNAPAWCVIAMFISIFVSSFSIGELDEKLA